MTDERRATSDERRAATAASAGLPSAPVPVRRPSPVARRSSLPWSLRSALAGNALLRVAGPATGILLTVHYLPDINNRAYPVDAYAVGALTAAFYVTELGASPLLGALGDRHGRRLLLLAGPLIAALALGLTAASTLLAVLLLARLLEGLSAAATVPAVLGQLSDETDGDPALRGRVLSVFEVTTALGTLVAAAVTTRLWMGFGRGSFLVVALAYLLAAALFLPARDRRARPGRPAVHASWRDSLALLRGQRAILRFLPAWLALSAITGLWFNHALSQMRVIRPAFAGQYLSGLFAENERGLELTLVAYALLFSAGIIGWGFVGLRRLHEVTVMRIGLAAMLGVCAGLFALNHGGERPALRVAALAVFAVLLVVESGFAPAAVTYLSRLSRTVATDRGLVMGLYTVVSGGGTLLGVALGAPFADRGALDGILLLTVLLAASALTLLFTLGAHD